MLLAALPAACQDAPDWPPLPEFSLTERSGRTVTLGDLRGRPWVADFFFAGCQGPCPPLNRRMSELQAELPPEVRLVSFTLDPANDTPAALVEYAKLYNADPERWLFLTGDRALIRSLVTEGFRQSAVDDPKEVIIHSLRIVLVDAQGKIHAWAQYDDAPAMARLVAESRRLVEESKARLVAESRRRVEEQKRMERLRHFPSINASLNGLCAVLLLTGFVLVKTKRIGAHKACMVSAFLVSIVFLACYLYYHAYAGVTRFSHEGWPKTLYLSVLGSHTVLAALVPFLAIITLRRGFRGDIERHRKIARWTFPIWLYVSITGVAVYWMLYHWRPV
ncbi:MAG: DUF420 domain-containing protein [Planctomycetota bacterium]